MATAADRGWGHPGIPGTASAETYRRNYIVKLDVGGIRLYVRREVAPLFAGFIHAITRGGFNLDRTADDWGYICRPIRGYESQFRTTGNLRYLSNHSWGLAIDLNATEHPIGRRHTGVPDWVVDEAKRWGLSWGGDFTNRPDEMHFEVLLTPPQVKDLVTRLTRPTTPADALPREELLMAVAKDDDDARWALVLEWFLDYLGRVPSSSDEHLLHVYVFGTKGAGACLSGIVNSQESKDFRQRRGW